MSKRKLNIFTKGFFKENPTFVLLLGLCPTLATTTSAINGLSMGLATLFVLVLSNIVISAIAPLVPDKVHIPVYIVVIATFVTILQFAMQAYTPDMYKTLGLFIPLIVVNCIVLGRAEAFASKNGIVDSALDGLGIGFGFTMSLTVLGLVREIPRKRVRLRLEVYLRRRPPRIRDGSRCFHRPGLSYGTFQQNRKKELGHGIFPHHNFGDIRQ